MITLKVTLYGEEQALAVEEEDIITFPEGLVGCPDWRRFVLLDVKGDENVSLLQSLDEPHVCLMVADPRHVDPAHMCPLGPADRRFLALQDGQEAVVLCTITYWEKPGFATANLLGPLVINAKARLGRQLVLSDSGYSARHQVGALAG